MKGSPALRVVPLLMQLMHSPLAAWGCGYSVDCPRNYSAAQIHKAAAQAAWDPFSLQNVKAHAERRRAATQAQLACSSQNRGVLSFGGWCYYCCTETVTT